MHRFRGAFNFFAACGKKIKCRPFDKAGDSFKKIVIVGGTMKPRYNKKGYLMIRLKEFLLDGRSLEY